MLAAIEGVTLAAILGALDAWAKYAAGALEDPEDTKPLDSGDDSAGGQWPISSAPKATAMRLTVSAGLGASVELATAN